MDENIMQETTQPEVDNAETETTEVDAEQTDTTAEEAKPEAEEGKADESTEENAPAPQESEEKPAEEPQVPKLRVKYNKQMQEYSLEDATPLVEMGLKYQDLKPSMEKLKFLATSSGKSVGDLVESLMSSADDVLYQQELAKCDGKEEIAKEMFELKKAERQRKFEQAVVNEQKESETEKQQTIERIAADYKALTKKIPEIKKFTDVPQSVVKTAIDEGIPLYYAYLDYQRGESQKVNAVKEKQAVSAKQSTGSLSGRQASPEPDMDDFSKAFSKALW